MKKILTKKIATLSTLFSLLLSTNSMSAQVTMNGTTCVLEQLVVDKSGNVNITCNTGGQVVTPPLPPGPVPVTPTVPIVPAIPASGDPGILTGTWLPTKTTTFAVVDQSYPQGLSGVTQIPGCVNQRSLAGGCQSATYPGIIWNKGSIISVRYRFNKIPDQVEYFKLNSHNGAGAFGPAEISLSSIPGDFTQTACKKQVTPGSQPFLLLKDACEVKDINKLYYFNIRLDAQCDNPYSCNYKLLEPSSAANP
jgi:hypothetical protein